MFKVDYFAHQKLFIVPPLWRPLLFALVALGMGVEQGGKEYIAHPSDSYRSHGSVTASQSVLYKWSNTSL